MWPFPGSEPKPLALSELFDMKSAKAGDTLILISKKTLSPAYAAHLARAMESMTKGTGVKFVLIPGPEFEVSVQPATGVAQ